MPPFRLKSEFLPQGDQEGAIDALVKGALSGSPHQVLLGVTGSGKTFTVANVISRLQRPALVISHNKTLAAQLYSEFSSFFPDNAVEYFVSYYDYYQPEAYLPQSDTYIEKDSSINEEIDKLRHSATRSLLERRDVIIVASVSCIYGLGAPDYYAEMKVVLRKGDSPGRQKLLRDLVDVRYTRNDVDFGRGTFRARGDVVEVFPAYEEKRAVRVEFFGDEIESLSWFDPLTAKVIIAVEELTLFPGSHYVIPDDVMGRAVETIGAELEDRLRFFRREEKLVEAQRLEQRTRLDLEMIGQLGFCTGIENYSRHLTGRKAGDPPPTLIEYFPEDFLVIVDESHVTLPQLRAMAHGDHSRKKNLVDHGFRLPSAFDNRPLTFEEFEERVGQRIFVSATPAPYELGLAEGSVIEQIIRPTGLMEPEVEVRPVEGQVEDLMEEIRQRAGAGERVLVTTLTKRMAEDLTEYYSELGVRVRYLHSEIDTLERVRLLRELRLGSFDALIGINLLREGLDLPEVSLVAVLDADKEGFLRSETSLVQTAGRAARNVKGKVILYADRMTNSIRRAIDETQRRRSIQEEFNRREGVIPTGIRKDIGDALGRILDADYYPVPLAGEEVVKYSSLEEVEKAIRKLDRQMKEAASRLEFELAAELRDRIDSLRKVELASGIPSGSPPDLEKRTGGGAGGRKKGGRR